MKKKFIVAAIALALIGCADMPKRTCTAIYESGSNKYEVYVFGTRLNGGELMLRAGYPFSFHYVNERQFTTHDCKR